jgi:hypothetical protein
MSVMFQENKYLKTVIQRFGAVGGYALKFSKQIIYFWVLHSATGGVGKIRESRLFLPF